MGKKSLFQSTSEPGKKAPASKATPEEKATPDKEHQSTAAQKPAFSGTDDSQPPVKETATTTPAVDTGRPDPSDPPAQTDESPDTPNTPEKRPEVQAETPTSAVQEDAAPATPAAAAEKSPVREIEPPDPSGPGGMGSGPGRPSDTDVDPPDFEGTYIKTAIGIVAALLLLLCLASFLNSGNYHVRETRGAVEIWQGTFSPNGKERLMVLPGADWNQPVKTTYPRGTVYAFAADFYVEKALTLADASRPVDYEQIHAYLNNSLALFAEIDKSDAVDVINQVGTYLTEAAILDASGEKEAMDLAERRLERVAHALSGLLVEKFPETAAQKKDS